MMKMQVLKMFLAIAFAAGSSTFIGCNGGGEHHHDGEHHEHMDGNHEEHAYYACPMDCEEGKTYEEPGQCSVCGMDLEEVNE